jgi:hypothetical protein
MRISGHTIAQPVRRMGHGPLLGSPGRCASSESGFLLALPLKRAGWTHGRPRPPAPRAPRTSLSHPRSLRLLQWRSSRSFGSPSPRILGWLSAGPTALRFAALLVRAAAAGARKGRERSCLAASRPNLIVPDPVGPLRVGRGVACRLPWGRRRGPPNGSPSSSAASRGDSAPETSKVMIDFGRTTDR